MPTMGATPPAAMTVASPDEALAVATAAANHDDLPAVVRVFDSLPPDERSPLVRKLMTAIVGQDLARAERVAEALPTGSMQTAAIEILARAMVDRDADAALRWALANASPAMKATVRSVVAERLLEDTPKAAMERLRALPASPARDEMLGYAAAAWARRDATNALGWVRGLTAGGEKDRLATSMSFALAQSEPARAVESLDTLPEGRDRLVLIGAIGQTWVARDATAAWKWARRLPEGPSREAALAGIETGLGGAGSRVARGDASAGVRVRGGGESPGDLNGLPPGVERDDALRRKFDEALRESPVNAASYLTSLTAPDRRDAMVDELVRRWLPLDPQAAKTWIDQNVTSPTRREQLFREAGLPRY